MQELNILKYPGGKAYMTKEIIGLMRPHKIYCEPCFGSGKIFFAKQGTCFASKINLLSDIDPRLMNFWFKLRDHPEILMQAFKAIPYGKMAFEIYSNGVEVDPDSIVDAMQFFIVSRMSRGGLGATFSDSSRQRRGMPEGESAYLSAINNFPMAAAFLRQAALAVESALVVLQKIEDQKEALIYLDPPYLGITGLYRYEMSEEYHKQLLEQCLKMEGKVLISGYDNPLYREILKGWTIHKFEKRNRQAETPELPSRMEFVWANYR